MIKKLYATYVIVTMWLILIPLTVAYVAIYSLLYLINPVELFSDMVVELGIDNAWDWRKIKRAFTR